MANDSAQLLEYVSILLDALVGDRSIAPKQIKRNKLHLAESNVDMENGTSTARAWNMIKIPIEWIVCFRHFDSLFSIKIGAQLLALASFPFHVSHSRCECVIHCLTYLWSVTKFINRISVLGCSRQNDYVMIKIIWIFVRFCWIVIINWDFSSPSFCRLLHTPSVCF